MAAEILKFPVATFVLTCRNCKSRDFEIHLVSDDPGDIQGFMCVGCGLYWDIDGISDFKSKGDPHES